MILDEKDANDAGALKSGYEFNLYSSSMICGVNEEVVDQCRKVVVR